MKRNRMTSEERLKKMQDNLRGTGLYIYENNTSGHLNLPKPTNQGKKTIAPKERFEGDSYFMMLVKAPHNMLRFISEIKQEEKKEMNESKLILEQPDIVTSKGKVEHVVDEISATQKLHDSTENKHKHDVLLTENPVDGVEIITN